MHDFNSGETVELIGPTKGVNIYSIGIYKGKPWINFVNDYSGLNNIFFYDIDNNLAINVTNNNVDERVYYQCTQMSADKKLIFKYYEGENYYVGIID